MLLLEFLCVFSKFPLVFIFYLNGWFDPLVLLYRKENLSVSLNFILGNIEILRKQNSLSLGPVIKC